MVAFQQADPASSTTEINIIHSRCRKLSEISLEKSNSYGYNFQNIEKSQPIVGEERLCPIIFTDSGPLPRY